MNLIDGRIDPSQRLFVGEGLNITLTEELLNRAAGQNACTLGVRPEHVRVSTIQSNHWTPVTVYVTELMGSETFVIIEMGSQKIIARTPGGFYVNSGRSAWISFDLSKAHLFDSLSGERLG